MGQNDLFGEDRGDNGRESEGDRSESASPGAHSAGRYAGERYLIERRGKRLAALVGVEELERLKADGGSPRSSPRGGAGSGRGMG